MKSMLKCSHSFFIVLKIFNRFDPQNSSYRQIIADLLEANLQYINDKTIKVKAQGLI